MKKSLLIPTFTQLPHGGMVGNIGKLFFFGAGAGTNSSGQYTKGQLACFVLLLAPAVAYAPHTGGKNKLQN